MRQIESFLRHASATVPFYRDRLRDVGFDGDELVDWLISEEESLTVSPVDALKAGRKAEVRRIAQALL